MSMWDPFQEVESLRREVERAFEEAGLGALRLPKTAAAKARRVQVRVTG